MNRKLEQTFFQRRHRDGQQAGRKMLVQITTFSASFKLEKELGF